MVFGYFVSMFSGLNSSAGGIRKERIMATYGCGVGSVASDVRMVGEGCVDHSPAELALQSSAASATT